MAQTAILAAISLPGVTTNPSSNCLQWGSDGQLILLARSSIYILTPRIGLIAQSPAATQQLLDKETKGDRRPSVQWLQTMIEWDKDSRLHQWPTDCQDWGAVSLGSLDPHFRSVTSSPNNLTPDAGCVLSVLNSNMQVSFWTATKNHLTGIWTKVGEYDGSLHSLDSSNTTDGRLYNTLQAQVTSIAWSTQANFATIPAPNADYSLLALGSRAGTVRLARYFNGSDLQTCLRSAALFSVSDRWITHLSWSPWSPLQNEQCEAFLACGISDGSVTVVKVTQSLHQLSEHIAFIKEYEVSVACDLLSDKPCEATNHSITSLQWIQTPKNRFLLLSSPGQLHLWSSAGEASAWRGRRVMTLRTIKNSVGSTFLAPLTGVSYKPRHDALVLSLADGSLHVVSHLSTDPKLSPSEFHAGISAEALSAVTHSVFLKVEERQSSDRIGVAKIGGMISFDNNSTHAWVIEATYPSRFDYKRDAQHLSKLVVADLWTDSFDEVLLDEVVRLTTVGVAPGYSPIASLRNAFAHLQNPETISRLHAQIMRSLKDSIPDPPMDSWGLPVWKGELDTQFRSAFRRSMVAHLFSSKLHPQRLAFSIAKFCQNHAEDASEQQQYEQIAQTISSGIWSQVLQILVRHLVASISVVPDIAILFILRIVNQALLPGTSADLGLEARELSAKLSKPVSDGHDLNAIGPEELCPACHIAVPFQNTLTGVCVNGHTWARCSITSFLLPTPMVRTCVGCGRKALLPPTRDASRAHWLPVYARNWVVEDLLDAIRRCLYCGNSFVTLI
ncbi:putative zinc-finger of transcription factor IIIC complex-domain-containing protein [Cristinia sonorae]|uniref:Zinc-finger of transcription factor IIIC complex-domain-containing protein n=1 Tax=Cristinia sonorae TaxID=1940300 RepID=A0A8K0UTN2_9AGAR|nr:putative zinc-finger of transcription factor IIIC complex-domain-containing protein [Cristinia sonorae]